MCYIEFTNWALNTIRSQIYWVSDNKITQPQYILVMKVFSANYQLSENQLFSGAYQITATAVSFLGIKYTDTLMKFRDVTTGTFLVQPLRRTQGLIETSGSMVIFDENQAVSDINKYKFLYPIYAIIINFLVI